MTYIPLVGIFGQIYVILDLLKNIFKDLKNMDMDKMQTSMFYLNFSDKGMQC